MEGTMGGGIPAGQIFLGRDGKVFGPFTREQLDAMRASGEIMQYHWLWDGSGQWVAAALPPPPPPAMPGLGGGVAAPAQQTPAFTASSPVHQTSTPTFAASAPAPSIESEVTEEIQGVGHAAAPSSWDLSGTEAPTGEIHAETFVTPDPTQNEPTEEILAPPKQMSAATPPSAPSGARSGQAAAAPPSFSRPAPGAANPRAATPPAPSQKHPQHQSPPVRQSQANPPMYSGGQPPRGQNLGHSRPGRPENAGRVNADLSAIRAVCFDRNRVINGTLARASGDGCVFTFRLSVHPQKTLFIPGRPVWLNLVDEASGRSENVRAMLASGTRQNGMLELQLRWESLPKLLNIAQQAHG